MFRKSSSLRVAGAFALLLAGPACSRGKTAPSAASSASGASLAPSASATRATPPGTLSQHLTGPTAFELTPSSDGATLVWAPADTKDGALLELELDAGGVPKAKPRELLGVSELRGEITDLTAAWVKRELALAWVERNGPVARVRAAWAANHGRIFELGPAWVAPSTARGNVALAARGDAALVFARGEETTCIENDRRGCYKFSFHELHADRAEATGLPLTVPVPCSEGSTHLAVVGSVYHYGVCTVSEQRPVTTLFTIQRNPDYARADTLLEGCEPVGIQALEDRGWLIGECEGRNRRAVRLGPENQPAVSLDLRTVRLECSGGIARVRAPGLELALDEPRGALQTLLPAAIAPHGARAVWTGRALLVATALPHELRMTSHTCAGDRLVSAVLDSASPAAGAQ